MRTGVIKTLNDVSHVDTKVFSLGGLNSLIRLQVVSVLSSAAGVQWMLGDAKQHSQRYVNSNSSAADDPWVSQSVFTITSAFTFRPLC